MRLIRECWFAAPGGFSLLVVLSIVDVAVWVK